MPHSQAATHLHAGSSIHSSGGGIDPWPVGTLIDCLDTENSWLLAKIMKVDLAMKRYNIHYLDWDNSWDENIPFTSPRLMPGGTHTGQAEVDKHVRKALLQAQQQQAASSTTAPSTTTAASAAATAAVMDLTGGPTSASKNKGKRKAV
jgi:hypothetical protein